MADSTVQLKSGMARASACQGARVVGPDGSPLGAVKELVVDFEGGRLAAVVVAFDGSLGYGDQLIPVPPAILTFDSREGNFLINLEPDTLRDGPSFPSGTWPGRMDRTWMAVVYSYYGCVPYWT
jgi:hypothetical protein